MKKKQIIGIVAVILLVAAMVFAYSTFSEKPSEGSKNITIEVIDSAEKSTVYEVSTDAEYLIDAMREAEGLEFKGDEGEYGMAISEINGEVADFNLGGAYWGFYVNGEYCSHGVSQQPVNDKDAFQIIYTVG